ncbi:replication-relaxation family protein [Streptomyces sp. NPDC058268]|uniref:replication-relaxation family protein n=1 Tax=Streptomyces sp. NPDC058268 TaxID=3346413 RepID=UPI0036E55021
MTTPANAKTLPFTPSPAEPLPQQLLAALAQHRLATGAQLHQLLRPTARRQYVSELLNRLRREELVDFTVLPSSHRTRAWFLTPQGARVTRDWPQLRGRPPYPITSPSAASMRHPIRSRCSAPISPSSPTRAAAGTSTAIWTGHSRSPTHWAMASG